VSVRPLRNSPSDTVRASETFLLAALIEALDALLENPGPKQAEETTTALRTLLRSAGAHGAYLQIDASPLPRLIVGAGTLEAGPATAGAPDSIRTDLLDSTGTVLLGCLWFDGPADPGASVARLIGRAVEGTWSRAKVVQSSERLAALDAATRGIANVLEVDAVLRLIVEGVRDLVRARYAALAIVDAVGVIERFITVGINQEDREQIGTLPRGHGLLGLIIREGRAYRIPEISDHPDSAGFPAHHPSMHSFLGVPITVKGVSVGNLYLTDKTDALEFAKDDQELVEMFALHAGIAIENARLHEQVQRLAIVEERERIAKDLHDGVIQSIYAVGLSLEDLPELMDVDVGEARLRIDRAIDALHMTIRDIRNFIMGLRPELLDQHDLVGSLQALAEEVRLNSMVEVETSIDVAAAGALPEHARAPVFHITREALSNVVRHSHATRASLVLRREGGSVRLEINDNGTGFDPDEERESSHQGLTNMAARASRHGGNLRLESAGGAGTRIIVTLDAEDRPPEQETR
jgi:signal transduction histidine kinase